MTASTFFGETPKCADGDADSHVDKCADKCKGEGNLRTVPNRIKGGLAGTAGTENGMQAEAPFVDRLCGTQMLLRLSRAGLRMHHIRRKSDKCRKR